MPIYALLLSSDSTIYFPFFLVFIFFGSIYVLFCSISIVRRQKTFFSVSSLLNISVSSRQNILTANENRDIRQHRDGTSHCAIHSCQKYITKSKNWTEIISNTKCRQYLYPICVHTNKQQQKTIIVIWNVTRKTD